MIAHIANRIAFVILGYFAALLAVAGALAQQEAIRRETAGG